MVQGFTKGGKFRPTGKSSGLKSNQILGEKVMFAKKWDSFNSMDRNDVLDLAIGNSKKLSENYSTHIETDWSQLPPAVRTKAFIEMKKMRADPHRYAINKAKITPTMDKKVTKFYIKKLQRMFPT